MSGWTRLRDYVTANPDLSYMALAVMLTIVGVGTMPHTASNVAYKDPGALATALVVVETIVIAFLRRWPMGVLFALFGTLIASAWLRYEIGNVVFLGALVVVFVVTYRSSRTQAFAALFLTIASILALHIIDAGPGIDIGQLAFNLAAFGGTWAGGMLVRTRVAQIAQVQSYAERLSKQRDIAAQEAVADERARIARELHDAVGHTLNLIVVQAGAAKRVRESNPKAAFDALDSIENTGRQALADMDRMLGILKESERAAGAAGLGPRPGLARLKAMLDEAGTAGLKVSLETTGTERKLPVSIDLTAYRIVQEAITNVMKHAPGADTTVRLDYAPRALGLEIQNGPSRLSASKGIPSGGRGLPGMEERVALFGGSMKYGPMPGGGFRVQVSLPVEETA